MATAKKKVFTKDERHMVRRQEAAELIAGIQAVVEDQGGEPKALKKSVKRLRKLYRKLRGE